MFVDSFPNMNQAAMLTLVGAAAWCGAVTCAYTIWAQSFGQGSGISATNANLIYTTQPLWSAAFAWLLLSEVPTYNEAAGGIAIASALFLAVTGANDAGTLSEGDISNSKDV